MGDQQIPRLEPSSQFYPGRSVSIDRAAEILHCCKRTIYNRIAEGRLQTIRTPGGSLRVTRESIDALGGGTKP